jgi:Rad3-related DNA helicase
MSNQHYLPAPSFLGLPEKYTSFRPLQAHAIYDITESTVRMPWSNNPTGSGKSLMPYTICSLMGWRGLTLTVTKALEDQYEQDLGAVGLNDIRGANNSRYPCTAIVRGEVPGLPAKEVNADHCVHDMKVHGAQYRCPHMSGNCNYFGALHKLQQGQHALTNYSKWLALGKQKHRKLQMAEDPADVDEGLGDFDALFMDEAHSAADEVGRALQIQLKTRDAERLTGLSLPDSEEPLRWQEWAWEAFRITEHKLSGLRYEIEAGKETQSNFHSMREVRSLHLQLTEVLEMEGEWVIEQRWTGTQYGKEKVVQFDPVWPTPYMERLLYRGVKKLVGLSGTITPKDVKYMGIDPKEFQFFEYPSSFPLINRPVWFMPKIRMHYGNDAADLKIWAAAVDNILRERADRKVIIPSVSYRRAEQLLNLSKYSDRMMLHNNSDTAEVVAAFKKSRREDLVLVGPGFGTGHNFPFDTAEVCIIVKTPWPGMDSKVLKARQKQDKDYANWYAAREIQQYAGRIVRDRMDRGETFIIDSSAGGLLKRKDLMAKYFRAAVKYTEGIPPAPPKLRRGERV